MNKILSINESLRQIGNAYYFHSGFGLYLRGLENSFDDCDIRVLHPNINELYRTLSFMTKYTITLRGPIEYENGNYNNPCIEIASNPEFDICTKMINECNDIERFEFPFDEKEFEDINNLDYQGKSLPVSSLESSLLYCLVLRRPKDERTIQKILGSSSFSKDKFEKYLNRINASHEIRTLYETRCN